MLNIMKNNTIFPDYIKLQLCNEFTSKINNTVKPYKEDVSDAVIYSLLENKNIKSKRRKSLKTSFKSDDIKEQIKNNICPLIYSMLKQEYPSNLYHIEIGEQIFDYIKYDNGGYFEPHRDWVRVTNSQQIQYTLIIGLTEEHACNYGGNTIIWIPVTELNLLDYKMLTESTTDDENFKLTCKKYNLPQNHDDLMILFKMNLSDEKYIPTKIPCYMQGIGLLFQSGFLHSGEVFYEWYKPKELLSLVINITGITNTNLQINQFERNDILTNNNIKFTSWIDDTSDKFIMFDEFESWMCSNDSEIIFKNNLLPFQIIVSNGNYNYNSFSNNYLRYINLYENLEISNSNNINILDQINKTLVDIYNKTKISLNKRGRETHITSELINVTNDNNDIKKLDGFRFNDDKIKSLTEQKNSIICEITNYYLNIVKLSNNCKVKRVEEVLNTWEESGCNDDGDEYDETTYLTCQIDIKFCFFKLDSKSSIV